MITRGVRWVLVVALVISAGTTVPSSYPQARDLPVPCDGSQC
jgi:hypothetical protein